MSFFNDKPIDCPDDRNSGMSVGLKYMIGISVSLAASCLSSLGVNIQAAALAAERERNKIQAQQVQDALQYEDLRSELDLLEAIPEAAEEAAISSGGGGGENIGRDENIASNNPTPAFASTDSRGNNVNLAIFSSNQALNNTTFSAPPSPIRRTGNNTTATNSISSSPSFSWRLFFLRSQWYFGFIIYLVCQTFGSIISLAFIPPSVVAPLGATGLIFNILFAKLFLGTPITRKNWIGTFLVVIGCSIVSLIGSKTTPSSNGSTSGDCDKNKESSGGGRLDMKTIIRIFSRPPFIIYFTLLSAFVIALLVLVKYLEHGGPLHRYNERTAAGREVSIGGDSTNGSPLIGSSGGGVGGGGAMLVQGPTLDSSLNHSSSGGGLMGSTRFRSSSMSSSITSPLMGSMNSGDGGRNSRSWKRIKRGLRRRLRKVNLSNLLGNLYSIIGGASASESLIFVGSGVDLLIQSIFGEKKEGEESNIGFSILLLALLLLTVVLQLYGLNRGLSFSLPTVVIPLFFTVYTILSFTNTLVFQSIVRAVLDEMGGGNKNGSSGLLGPTGDFILVCLGLVMIVGGVWMLGEPAPKNHEDGSHGERQPLLGPDSEPFSLEGGEDGVETDAAFASQQDQSSSAPPFLNSGRKRRSFPNNSST